MNIFLKVKYLAIRSYVNHLVPIFSNILYKVFYISILKGKCLKDKNYLQKELNRGEYYSSSLYNYYINLDENFERVTTQHSNIQLQYVTNINKLKRRSL